MGALDDLRAGGFSESEINNFAAEKRQTLSSAGFSDQEVGSYLGTQPQPDMAGANKTFSRVIGDALHGAANTLKPAGETMTDIGQVYPAVEAALNAGTGLLFGFPAYVGAGLGGLISKHLLGMDADPKELAETMSKVFTYQPMTERGARLTGNVMLPLTKLVEGADYAGEKATDAASWAFSHQAPGASAAVGAVTSATIQMLAPVLLGELTRKMGGQQITHEDMQNTAKVIAGPDAKPADVATVEASLRATYDKTGIGPYTVMEEAHRNPGVMSDLLDPTVEVPKEFGVYHGSPHDFEAFSMDKIGTGDGAPLLDVSGPTASEDFHLTSQTRSEMEAHARDLEQVKLGDEATQKRIEDRITADALRDGFTLTGSDRAADVAAAAGQHGLFEAVQRPAFDPNAAPTLDHPEYRDSLSRMANETGWAERGGKLIREFGDEGEVTGRTSWIPNADWWPGRPKKGLKENEVAPAIRKALAGEPLGKHEQQMVDYLLDYAQKEKQKFAQEVKARYDDMEARIFDAPPKAMLQAATLKDSPADRVDAALSARAAALDEVAFERAAIQHENNDAAFMTAIREILKNEDKNAETRNGSSGNERGQEAGTGAELYPGGTVELNAGINARTALRDYVGGYTPYIGVDQNHPWVVEQPKAGQVAAARSPLLDSLQKIFAPAARGDIAQQQAGIMRANFGEMAHQREVALEKLKPIAARFDKMPVAENIAFIDAMERGTTLADPELAEAAKELRSLLDYKRDEVQALGKGNLENFDENYFPHIWKQHDEAQALYSRRPLTGSGAFLKQRIIPLTTDGLRWRAYDAEGDFIKSFDTEAQAKSAVPPDGRIGSPLTPITTNPVELAMLKAREMDKYIYGQHIFQEMKDADLARFVRFGDRALPGWTKINDKIARVWSPADEGGMILRGEYYAPDEAATLINNHLSPGLQGNGFYDAWRGVGMALNSVQLGLSAFHVGFTTMDAMVSKASLGMKQLSRGDIMEGAGNVAQGLNPAQPFINIYKGDKLLRAYLGKLDSPEMAPIVDAIVQAGGRVKMDDFYRNTTVNAFKQAVRAGDVWGATKSFLPTVLDRMVSPIFEELVPRQKLGVYFDMAKDWLEKNPDAGVEAKRAGLGKLWDSVDNRMGQLVYDNVFWNHALKDGLMATVRSVGWNLGTFRELGGGMLDIKDIPRNKGFSDRTAYVVALPFVAAVYGSILNYLYTGKPPETLKDAFYPKTGKIRPDGSEDRVSLPTYMKDVFAYGEDATNFAKYGSDPTQTLKNKAHPLISTVSQMLNNEDFFGATIRNPSAPAVQQLLDETNYLIKQIEPFSLRNYQQQAKAAHEEPTVGGYLTSPSMIGVTPAPGYIVKSEAEQQSSMVAKLRDPLMKKFRQDIKDGADVDKMIPQMIAAGLSRQDIKYVISTSGETPRPHRLKSFGETP